MRSVGGLSAPEDGGFSDGPGPVEIGRESIGRGNDIGDTASIIDRADDVEVIDITPHDLIQRL